jgi:hypothetical protein
MEIEPGRSVERSRLPWLGNRLPTLWAWLTNDVPAAGTLPVTWLKRGASASELLSGIRRARHGIFLPGVQVKEAHGDGSSDHRGGSAQGIAYGSGDRRGREAPGPAAGAGPGRAGRTARGMGAGLAAADLGDRRLSRDGVPAGPAAGGSRRAGPGRAAEAGRAGPPAGRRGHEQERPERRPPGGHRGAALAQRQRGQSR